jgi:hypothetical protein
LVEQPVCQDDVSDERGPQQGGAGRQQPRQPGTATTWAAARRPRRLGVSPAS